MKLLYLRSSQQEVDFAQLNLNQQKSLPNWKAFFII